MRRNETSIHATAAVHPKAKLDVGVWVGPYAVIGEKVSIGKNTRIEASVFIDGLTEIGENCHFSPYSSIGTEPQDVSYKGEETRIKIGDRNVFREFITVHRGTVKGEGTTRIGDGNYFMAYSHIAHDCQIGNETTLTNGATLGGHVTVGDHSTVSAFTGIHQFCRVGKYAYIGGYSVITQDVLPYCLVAGSRPPLLFGLNVVGLRRHGFSRERLQALKEMFKIVFYSDLNMSQALTKIQADFPSGEDRDEILHFIESSKRGIIKKASEQWNADLG